MLWVQFIYNGVHGGGGGGSLRKMNHMSNQLFKRKMATCQKLPQNKHVTKRKRKQMWKGGGIEMVDMMKKTREGWRHGMGNRTKQDNSIIKRRRKKIHVFSQNAP